MQIALGLSRRWWICEDLFSYSLCAARQVPMRRMSSQPHLRTQTTCGPAARSAASTTVFSGRVHRLWLDEMPHACVCLCDV